MNTEVQEALRELTERAEGAVRYRTTNKVDAEEGIAAVQALRDTIADALICGQSVWTCPEAVKNSLARYVQHGIPTGGFVRAVLENDLAAAVGRADATNVRCLPGIAAYVWQHLPVGCSGSIRAVANWIAEGGERGRAALAEAASAGADGPLPREG